MYSVVNGVGALFIMVSLYYNFNLSSFVIEVFWVAISLIGIIRGIRKRWSGKEVAP